VLVIMAGLPASGKTAISRALAREIRGVHVRIDTIEQAVVRSGAASRPLGPVGYVVGYAIAEDHLRQGLTVVADSVNPLQATRDAWCDIARSTGSDFVEVEVVCSDPVEHRKRATSRSVDIPGLTPPGWRAIVESDYEPWHRSPVVIDTAGRFIAACVRELMVACPGLVALE
jgi:predicted kinase